MYSKPWHQMQMSGQHHAPKFYTRERAPLILYTVGEMDPRAGLDVVTKRKIPAPSMNGIPVILPIPTTLLSQPSLPPTTN